MVSRVILTRLFFQRHLLNVELSYSSAQLNLGAWRLRENPLSLEKYSRKAMNPVKLCSSTMGLTTISPGEVTFAILCLFHPRQEVF